MGRLRNAILGLGSNIENRMDYLDTAVSMLSEFGTILKTSKIYTTPPFGFESNTDFLNMCILLETAISPEALLTECNRIEKNLGRTRSTSGFTSRTIDIDIIFYDDEVIQSDQLIIPHPEYKNRKFVLTPLLDIDKTLSDPVTGENIEHLLVNCEDDSKIVEYSVED